MSRRVLRAPRGAIGAVACALLFFAGAVRAAPTRIMPLGDSITGSPGCWRALLWNQLQAAGYTRIDMVGTRAGDGCGVAYDGDNEGWAGYLVMNIASQNQLPPWLAQDKPDIVMMHLGTNDVWNGRTPDQILAAYTTLVGQMRAQNPSVKIIVSQIIPMDSARSCASCAQGVVNLDAAIPAWAAGLSTTASPITVVDQWTGFSTAADTYDGVHPNDSGNQKMAARLFPAVVAALGGTQTPDFTLSASPASLSVAASGAAASVTSTVTVAASGGFAGSVALSASGGPAGATFALAPAATTSTSVVTVTVPANVQPGSYTVTVTGTSGSLSRTAVLALDVGAPASIALSASPASLTLTQGGSVTSAIAIARTSFTGAVTLTSSVLPSGVTAGFGPATTTGNGSTLTLTASGTAATGTATVTITGADASGGLRATATLALTVNPAATGTAPCASAVSFSGNTGSFGTTGPVCFRTAAPIHGWGCYNLDGRTLLVNGVATACGASIPAPWADGYTYFAAGAGTYPWAGIYAW